MSLVRPMNPYGQSTVASGSLNNINQTETRIYNNPSGLPDGTSGYVICETNCVDSNTATQLITFVTSQNTIYGATYPKFYRAKTSGTWRDWAFLDINSCYCIDRGSATVTSITVDISNIPNNCYLMRCTNSVSPTQRYGSSLYMAQLAVTSDVRTMYFYPIVETNNTKISQYTLTGNSLKLTYDASGYHTVTLRRL